MGELVFSNANQDKLKASARMLEKRKEIMLEQAKTDELDKTSEKIVTLFEEPNFQKKLFDCGSVNEIKMLCSENELDLTEDMITEMLKSAGELLLSIEKNDGELTEDELEQIAGGWSLKGFLVGFAAGALIVATGLIYGVVTMGTGGVGGVAIAGAISAVLGTGVGMGAVSATLLHLVGE